MLYSDILDDVLENKSDMQKSLCECRGIFVFAALDFTKELLGMCRGRCPHRPADLPEGSNFLVQPCRNRPAEFARFSRCPPGACQRRLLPLPVSVMLIFKSFLVQMGAFYFYGVCKFVHKPPLKGEGDQRSWWRGSAEIFYSCFRFHGRNPSVSLWLPAQHKTRPTGALSGEPVA